MQPGSQRVGVGLLEVEDELADHAEEIPGVLVRRLSELDLGEKGGGKQNKAKPNKTK